ncbi:carboxypeptidase-like regulatory domain-containing protein [Pedobacter sp. AW1-32]|uniref:carboxypeptidase-like regulatory domain-containing protein n=1 Tax=Pedobacter sp. AW1-32 TaxID=3383026 RepID=UPI003FEDF9A2
MFKILRLMGILWLGCYIPNLALGQTTQASISGIIRDETKQAVPGVSVQVKNESTGFTTKTATNAKGEYTFKELPLGGPYSVKALYVGYGEQLRTGYMLNLGDVVRVNIDLQVAAQTLEAVQVVASGLRNKTHNFGASTEIRPKL